MSVPTILTIYVPANAQAERILGIVPGSGIAGSFDPDIGRLRIDFEGNLHNAVNIVSWEDRVKHAAGRHVWNDGKGYPTIARLWVEPDQVRAVGTYDTATWRVVEITDQPAVDAWVARYKESQ